MAWQELVTTRTRAFEVLQRIRGETALASGCHSCAQCGDLAVPVSAFRGAVQCNEHPPSFSAAAATRTIWLKPDSRPSTPQSQRDRWGYALEAVRHYIAAKKRTKESDVSIGSHLGPASASQ